MWSLKEKPVVNNFSQRWPQSHILQPDPPRDFSECRLGLTQLATEVLAVIALRDAAKPKISPEDAQRLLDAANAAIPCIGGAG